MASAHTFCYVRWPFAVAKREFSLPTSRGTISGITSELLVTRKRPSGLDFAMKRAFSFNSWPLYVNGVDFLCSGVTS